MASASLDDDEEFSSSPLIAIYLSPCIRLCGGSFILNPHPDPLPDIGCRKEVGIGRMLIWNVSLILHRVCHTRHQQYSHRDTHTHKNHHNEMSYLYIILYLWGFSIILLAYLCDERHRQSGIQFLPDFFLRLVER